LQAYEQRDRGEDQVTKIPVKHVGLAVLLLVQTPDVARPEAMAHEARKRVHREQESLPPCPPPRIDVTSWVRIDCRTFSLKLPKEFRKVKVRGIDSYVGSFATVDSSATLLFDWGGFSDPLTRIEGFAYYASCTDSIGGKTARLISATRRGQGDRVAAAAWREVVPGVHLTIWCTARDRRGAERLLAALRTVEFRERGTQGP
jgi:hypothetical protein